VLLGLPSRNSGAAFARTIVDQQQLPTIVALTKGAFDRFLNKGLGIQEDCDYGDHWLSNRKDRLVLVLFFCEWPGNSPALVR
jgi:hypothetical protein